MSPLADRRADFRPSPGEIPTKPGVYRFSDRSNRVLYIGKAKNLRNRISNYFGPLDGLNPRTQRMVLLAARVDWTVVATDTEALVLEHTWINEMRPPFNVQFKDDKSYPFLAVTLRSEAPRLIVTRNRSIPGARYFGPFPKLWAVRETVALLQKAFPIRTCNDATYQRAMRTGTPCLASQIGRCHGPCSQRVSREDHLAEVQRLVQFLSGQDTAQLRELRADMQRASADQDYERAALLRDQLAAAELVLEKNTVVLRESVNADVFGFTSDELHAAVHQFIIRQGRIRGERSWIVEKPLDEEPGDLIASLLLDAFEHPENIPGEILVSHSPAQTGSVCETLAAFGGHKVTILNPQRGEKRDIVERAELNAKENLQRHKLKRAADIVTRTDALAEIQRVLSLDEVPLRIECVDISHLGGTDIVGSLVAFEDGLPAKSGYRHYRIDEARDDSDSIAQVVTRRFARLLNESQAPSVPSPEPSGEMTVAEANDLLRERRDWPQLLIVDGGAPQVAAAIKALRALGIDHVALVGLAKRLEELWLPESAYPVILPRSSEALFLMQRIRDEAHRFAITYQRKRRSGSVATTLADIPGLGEKRAAMLLRTFKSVKRIRMASIEELAVTPGISVALAERIANHFA